MDLSAASPAAAEGVAFAKMHACGNDFVVVDDRQGRLRGAESALARDVCRRRLSLGADGLLVLRPGHTPGAFGMVFVNADGLVGEMCGNGARCLAAFIHRLGLAQARTRLETLAGPVTVDYRANGQIALDLPLAVPAGPGVTLQFGGQDWCFHPIDVGPPHVVCWVPDRAALAAVPVLELGRFVRHHGAFAPRGCNVNFAAWDGARLHMRTYERGVEDETLGCGTGATAAVLLAQIQGQAQGAVEVVTRSGDVLRVEPGADGTGPRLIGGAHFVAHGVFDNPALEAWSRGGA